jgi:SAM-dependent methyltransferase
MYTNNNEISYDTCPICTSSINRWRSKIADNKTYHIDRCIACGFAFVNPRPSLSFLMDFYSKSGHQPSTEKLTDDVSIVSIKDIESKDPNSTIDAGRMINMVRGLLHEDSNEKFIDVGCGYGFFSKEAIENGFKVTPLELAQVERKIANDLLGICPIDISFESFDCSSSSFSVVLMSQILEHALDINLWIKKAHNLLEPNGIIARALPNYGSIFRIILQENEPYICPPAHVNFFNPGSLSKLLMKHGFKVESIQWVSRIPKRTFEKRIPKLAAPILPVINGVSHIALKGIDIFHLGMIINIYARKAG